MRTAVGAEASVSMCESSRESSDPSKARALSLKARKVLRGGLATSFFVILFGSLVYLGLKGVQPFQRWSVNSLLLAAVILAYYFLRFESAAAGPRELALVATLGAVAAAGRVLFAALPGIQPVTFMALLSGYVFGKESGFVVGALAALLSNFFLGHGPWTSWQMLGWGLAGVTGGWLHLFSRGERKRAIHWGMRFLVISGMLWGFLFGWLMDLWYWVSFIRPLDWRSLAAAMGSSFWFDLFHSLGNVAFALLLGPAMFSSLLRFRGRLEVVWEDETDSGEPGEEGSKEMPAAGRILGSSEDEGCAKKAETEVRGA